MTEEKVRRVEEKEGKRKIKVVSQIDDLLAIQGQYYLKGQLQEALDLANRIIELAEMEELASFIEDQERLIAKIRGIIQKKEEKKRAKILSQLMDELENLEAKFNTALSAEKFSDAEDILKNAKRPLFQLGDEKINLKWKNLEFKYSDKKARKDIIKEVLKLIEEYSELKENFLFEDLKLRLTYLMKQVQGKDMKEYLDKLKEIEKETFDAENSYYKIKADINKLSEDISIEMENKEIKLAIKRCEELIKLAKSINLCDIVEDYSGRLIYLEEELDFEELKKEIKKLSDQGLILLQNGKLLTSIEKFNKVKYLLEKYT
ncbi:MAG: hypothetical protein ACFFE4_23025 [Candidatus Thorarchaeota archaeon]